MRWFADPVAQEAAKSIDGIGAKLQPLAKKIGRKIDRGQMTRDDVLVRYDGRLRPQFELTLHEMGRILDRYPRPVTQMEISAFAMYLDRKYPDVNFRLPKPWEGGTVVQSPAEAYGEHDSSTDGGGEMAAALILSLAAVAAVLG